MRKTAIAILTWLTLALVFSLAVVLSARADSIARQGSDWVRLTALACKDEAVRSQIALAGDDPDDFRAASAHFGGQDFSACWKPMFGQRVVFLRYGDGDAGAVPFDDLKPLREI